MFLFFCDHKVTLESQMYILFGKSAPSVDLRPSVSSEAGCRRGADAAAGPRREPVSHDAGHHGSEFVLLQRQTDDGESPRPARALTTFQRSPPPPMWRQPIRGGDAASPLRTTNGISNKRTLRIFRGAASTCQDHQGRKGGGDSAHQGLVLLTGLGGL